MDCRILESKKCTITSAYGWRDLNNDGKQEYHSGVDIVREGYRCDYIVAHSDGKIVNFQDGLGNMKGSNSYGNYVKIDHGNGYYTLYAHMRKGLSVKNGQTVKAGQRLGYMGDSGNAYGAHLHFEVWEGGNRINPTPYLNKALPEKEPEEKVEPKYNLGDTVTVNGIYESSTSTKKLKPLYTKGKITRILDEVRNPYLIDDGGLGWANDDCITGKAENKVYKTVTNCSWLNLRTSASYGNNIYKAVKKGNKVEYLGLSNGWAKIKYDNKTLYCGKNYLK